MSFRIYLGYKLDMMKKSLSDTSKELRKNSTALWIYTGLLFGSLILRKWGLIQVKMSHIGIVALFIGVLWVWYDYKKGRHTYWDRQRKGIPSKAERRRIKHGDS